MARKTHENQIADFAIKTTVITIFESTNNVGARWQETIVF